MTTPSKPGADAVLSVEDAAGDVGLLLDELRAHAAALRERARQAEEARAAAQSVNILKDAENARLRERVAALEAGAAQSLRTNREFCAEKNALRAQAEADAAAMKRADAEWARYGFTYGDEGYERMLRAMADIRSRLAAREG